MLMTILGGTFSIGGLYVSFGNMRTDIDRHQQKIDHIYDNLKGLDPVEVKEMETRLSRIEGAIVGIDRQLDRIERNLEGRR